MNDLFTALFLSFVLTAFLITLGVNLVFYVGLFWSLLFVAFSLLIILYLFHIMGL